MSDIKQAYAASSPLTITLASLASSSSLLGGREGTAFDNSATGYLDLILGGQVTTGTGPTAGQVEVHVVAMSDDTRWPDVFDGTDSAETITLAEIKNSICKIVVVMGTTTTSNQVYPFSGISVANLFGGTLPKKWVAFVTHNTVAALNATGTNHFLAVTPVYATYV